MRSEVFTEAKTLLLYRMWRRVVWSIYTRVSQRSELRGLSLKIETVGVPDTSVIVYHTTHHRVSEDMKATIMSNLTQK